MLRNASILGLLVTLCTAAQANIVVNGDFEADAYTLGGADAITTLTGWNINGIGDVAGIGDGYLGGVSQKIDLSGYADVAGSGINQSMATFGITYDVSFEVFAPIAGTVTFKLNGATVDSGLGTGTHTYSFIGSGIDNIEFVSEGGNTPHLDNVSVEAVPEPASMAALGLGAMAMIRRRRQSK